MVCRFRRRLLLPARPALIGVQRGFCNDTGLSKELWRFCWTPEHKVSLLMGVPEPMHVHADLCVERLRLTNSLKAIF